MAQRVAGTEIPSLSSTLREPLHRASWGDIWRAEHQSHGAVILVLYDGEGGPDLFREALPGLKRWKTLNETATATEFVTLLEIIEHPTAPATISADPGGPTWKAFTTAASEDPVALVRAVREVALGLVMTRTYDIEVLGIFPDAIVGANPKGGLDAKQKPWRLIPVAPGVRRVAVAEGRYYPPEFTPDCNALQLCPDTYGLVWIAIEALSGEPNLPREPALLHEKVRLQRLRLVLGNGVKPSQGSYGDPKLLQLGLDRWIKNEAEEDLEEIRRAEAAARRTGKQQFLFEHRRLLIGSAIGFLALLAVIGCLLAIPALFIPKSTTGTPVGLSQLFCEALVRRDAAKAKSYTAGEATDQVDRLLADITRMEQENLTSRFAKAAPAVRGAGETRTVKATLFGSAGDAFMDIEFTIREREKGKWTVENLFFQPLREKDDS